MAATDAEGAPRGAARVTLAAALAYGLLALWITWPLWRLPDQVVDSVAIHGPFGWLAFADILLVVWALTWDVHALATAPLGLLDANVFHPSAGALARADHFLGNLPLFAPLLLASGNPVRAHQALLVLTFPLSALAMFAAVRAWTGSPAAGFVSGLLFGFAPWRRTQIGHVQILATIYLPLVLLAAGRVVHRGGWRAWTGLAAATILQALSSVYLALTALVAAAAMVTGTWSAPGGVRGRTARAAAALVLLALLALLTAAPYLGLARVGALPDPEPAASGEAPLALLAARPLGTYLLPSSPPSTVGYYFLGWSCVVLAAVAVARRRADGEAPILAPRQGLLFVVVAGWLLALGYAWHLPGGAAVPLPLGWLAALAPGFGAFRAPVRLGLIVALALPALAGLGYALIERRLTSPRRRAQLAFVVVTLFLVELAPRPVPVRPVPVGADIPAVYRWLAEQPPGPVLELPTGFVDDDFRGDPWAARWESGYQYASTVHWRPLLNGYSAHPPASFFFLMTIAQRLPDRRALTDLVELAGLRWLIVHRAAQEENGRGAWDRAAGLQERARFGDDVVYEVQVDVSRDLRGVLRDERPRARTLNGLSRETLPAEAMRGVLGELVLGPILFTDAVARGAVTLENRSALAWPGFDPHRRGLVAIATRWHRADAPAAPGRITTRLAHDLQPGERFRVPFAVLAPGEPGRYTLEVTLRQMGGPWFEGPEWQTARQEVEVRPWPRAAGPS